MSLAASAPSTSRATSTMLTSSFGGMSHVRRRSSATTADSSGPRTELPALSTVGPYRTDDGFQPRQSSRTRWPDREEPGAHLGSASGAGGDAHALGDDLVHDLIRACADAPEARVAVGAADGELRHVAGAA